jgi:hypothetical protein
MGDIPLRLVVVVECKRHSSANPRIVIERMIFAIVVIH